MNDILDSLKPAELSKVFAIEVVGWHLISKSDENEPAEWELWHDEDNKMAFPPMFAHNAQVLLPFLYKEHWEVKQSGDADKPIVVIINSKWQGEADNLPEAGVKALIRAHRANMY